MGQYFASSPRMRMYVSKFDSSDREHALRIQGGLCECFFVNGRSAEWATCRTRMWPLGAIMTEPMFSADRWARLLGWTTIAGVMCALIGPYGSFIANPINRFCFWVSVFWAGTIILWPAMTFATRWAERRSIPVLFATGVAMLLACVPLAAFAWAACSLLWPVHASGIMPQEWYALTFIVAAPSTAAAIWLERSRHDAASPSATESFVKTEERERLPDRLLDQIICVEMEDHHLRAHTVAGSALYYGSMREAAVQLGKRGLQVHRGWWVAFGAVDGFKEVDRAFILELKNGLSVPVARNRVAQLRAEGWLQRPQ